MKRSGFTLLEKIGLLGILLFMAAVLFPVFFRARESGPLPRCQPNLKPILLGLLQYSQDFDDHLPAMVGAQVPGASYGWADAVYPYIRNRYFFHCPTVGKGDDDALPTARGYTDYWLNGNLVGVALADAKAPNQTLAIGDGNDGSDLTDARYTLASLPAWWVSDQNSPANRHKGGANYAFLDGHVKWLAPTEISSGAATFALK